MKTAQIISRDLHGLPVRQNHKTGMLCANDLIQAHKSLHPQSKKSLRNFMRNSATTEYVEHLAQKAKESQESKYPSGGYLQLSLVEADCYDQAYRTSKGSKNGGTWMHPKLFYDFAMYLSVEFKDWAMDCIVDRLIQLRDEAGDTFKEVNIALGPQRQIVYIEEARMINNLVFGKPNGGQRNKATEAQLGMLKKLQAADVKLIKKGLTFEQRKKNLKIFKELLEN